MLPEQQQRILGYFLEEARDHLNTIEQGLLNLQSTLDDPEMINEVFRAAHSIKGGAAMLGLSSIQHTSHRLEDCFKLLKDNPVKIDEKLETLFLGVSDTLKVLLENLGGPFGLSEEAANTLMAQTEPVFQGLHQHLELLVQQGGDFATPVVVTKPEPVLVNAATSSSSKPKQTLQPLAKGAETRIPSAATAVNDQRSEFQSQVLQILREMLQLFKQATTPSTRQNLEQCCHKLVKLGEGLDLPNWCNLCTAAGSAIANPDNTYLILAKIVITEIKQAQELVLKGRESEITISQQLKAIISLPEIEELEITPDFVNEQPQAVTESTETLAPVTADLQPQNAMTDLFEIQEEDNGNVYDGLPLPSSEQLQVTPANVITPINFAANSLFDHEDEALLTKSSIDPHGPEVGIAELNTLADLFEGESPELEDSWHQEETIDIISTNSLGTEDSDVENVDHDLDDFLFDDNTSNNERPTATNSTEDLTLLFGDENFLDNENSESQNQLTDVSTAEVSNISLSDTDLLSSPVNILGEFTESSSDFQPYPQEAAPTISVNDVDENSLVLSSEIGDLFNEPEITAAKVSTAEEELNRFWNQTEETPLLQLDSGADEQDVARELEENLFAAAVSEDIFADSQQSIPSSVASFDIEDFDISVPQPEQSLDLRLVSDAENNLFEDLEAANSIISPAIIDSSEVSLQEIHSFSQEPEAVDFMPEFANQPLEATATGSPNTFAEMAIDLFETVDDNSEENLSLPGEEVAARDSTYIQPFASDDLFGNLDDSSEENLSLLGAEVAATHSSEIQPETTDLATDDLFGNFDDSSEENLSLSEEVAATDSTYIQPFASDDLFGNLDDSSEENLSLSEEVAATDSTYIQPFASDDLFGNLDDSSEENLSLSEEVAARDSTYIQPFASDDLFGNLDDSSEENLSLSEEVAARDSTYIQPFATDDLFGNLDDSSEENLSLLGAEVAATHSSEIQPETTDLATDDLFGNFDDSSEENLSLSEEVAARDSTYIQPFATDDLFGNLDDSSEENLSLSEEVAATDSTYIQPFASDDLFGNLDDNSEENLSLPGEEVAARDSTYIQPFASDDLFGNLDDSSEENLSLSEEVAATHSSEIQPETTDLATDDLFGNLDDSSAENLSLSEEVAARDSTYIQPFASDDLFGNLDDSSTENLSLSEEVAARDSTYIQPFASDDLFGNLDDSSEENLSLSEEVAARDSTYIQPFATDDLFGNLDDSSEENLSLLGAEEEVAVTHSIEIQPEITDLATDDLFGNLDDSSTENLSLPVEEVAARDSTYIQPFASDDLFGNLDDSSTENLSLSEEVAARDSTYIQPFASDDLFGNLDDSSEENLSLLGAEEEVAVTHSIEIQPEITDLATDDLFGNLDDSSEENLSLPVEEVAARDSTYIQPFASDDLFGNLDDSSEENLSISDEVAARDSTYIQPFASDDLFGNLDDSSEENLSLSEEVAARDSTYIQTFASDDLFGNLDDSSAENLSLSEEVAVTHSSEIQPETTDLATDDLFGNLDDSSAENLSISEEVAARDSTYIQPFASDDLFGNLDENSEENLSLSEEVAATDSTYIQPFASDDLFGNLDENSEENLSLPGEDAFEFTEITVAETAQLSLVDDLLETETALAEVTSQEELVVNTVSDLPAIDEFINIPTQEDEFNLEIEQNLQGDLSEDLLDIGEINQAAPVIGEESTIVIPTEELEVETAIDVAPEDDSSVLDEFAELEALLGDELAPVVNTAAIPEEDFAALEALLGSDNDEAVAMPSEKPQSETQPVLAQTHNVVSSPVIDEFDDLEKLLAEADQTISHSPPTKSNTPRTARSSTRRAARFEETMKVPVKQLDDMSNLVGELVVNRNTLEQDHERLRQSLDNLLIQVQQLSDVGARMQELYERSLLEASLLASRKPKEIGIPIPDSNTDRGFSELEMDRFTPFHTLSQEMIEFIVRVRESASDIDFVTEETERVARQFRQVTTQLQEGLTRARMVPFAQAVDSKRRGVRDNAIKCGKQVELVIEGGDTLIDKMILDHLTDPLTHMLNNAIAHGIETPDVRIAAGKSPVGYITIRAFHQGNQTVISVGDDGAGINSEQVKAKAVRIGLITPEQAKTISRLEIYDLLFQPGFSMKDKADEMSGRGVGMDVVRSQISEIRGIVNTDSVIGKGTNFTIRLPLTLSICKALCCVSDKARIAFPMDGVEDTLDIPVKNIQQDADGQSFIYWRDTVLPFRPLKELLTFNRQLSRGNVYGGTRDDDMVSVVVVRSANTLVALQVDQVLSEQEIVIKQFEGPAPKPSGVAGATVLGDGRIMPIADVLEIIDIFQGNMSKQTRSSTWQNKVPPPAAAAKIDPTVLIVDDSITVRELLSLTFNKAGYRVEQARDGQEAWDKLRSGLPCDIVFCDIEMPRCDGLELLSRIQKDPNLNHLPIAMLTSRGADKHRQMAIQFGASGYFTKPYLEEALLEAASRMLKGEKLVTTV